MSQGLADGGDLRLECQVNATSGFTQAISFAAKAMRSGCCALGEGLQLAVIKTLARYGDSALSNQQGEIAAEFIELGLSIDNLVETAHAGLMRCLPHDGQSSLAVAAYQRCRRTLWNALGLSEPTNRPELVASGAGWVALDQSFANGG